MPVWLQTRHARELTPALMCVKMRGVGGSEQHGGGYLATVGIKFMTLAEK